MDGPTLEAYVAAGYDGNVYPPIGYAELPSPGLTAQRAAEADEYLRTHLPTAAPVAAVTEPPVATDSFDATLAAAEPPTAAPVSAPAAVVEKEPKKKAAKPAA